MTDCLIRRKTSTRAEMAAMEATVPDILKAAESKVYNEPVDDRPSTLIAKLNDNELHRFKIGLTMQTMDRLK